jgi:hypothetical protein
MRVRRGDIARGAVRPRARSASPNPPGAAKDADKDTHDQATPPGTAKPDKTEKPRKKTETY